MNIFRTFCNAHHINVDCYLILLPNGFSHEMMWCVGTYLRSLHKQCLFAIRCWRQTFWANNFCFVFDSEIACCISHVLHCKTIRIRFFDSFPYYTISDHQIVIVLSEDTFNFILSIAKHIDFELSIVFVKAFRWE